MPKKPRITEIELLRGMAFLAVALQHAIAHYSVTDGVRMEDGVMMTVLLMASKFAVPVFIFITGMVLFYNYDGPLNYASFLRKRFSDILVPYMIWSAVYFIVMHQGEPFTWEQLWKWFTMLFTGKNSYHLWYVVMIFQFYLVFPLFRFAFRKMLKHLNSRYQAGLLLLTGLLYLWLISNVGAISGVMEEANIPVLTPMFTVYADRNFLYFSLYFILGAAAGLFPEMWRNWIHRGKSVYWPVFIALFLYYTHQVVGSFQTESGLHISFNSVSLLQPLIALFLISSIFVFYRYAERISLGAEKGVLNCFIWLGKYSYGAYLVHALMLKVSYKADSLLFAGWSVSLRMLMSFLICILLSYLLTAGLSCLPLGKWTAGVSARRRKEVTAVNQQLHV